ncbi:MAG: vWA domain-containing protein [Nonlabens sp.]|uniref:vWA domain-containing protein n=1 Tax=Nonlabens sp. TaxID=1888209 RepID=UPI003EF5161C
MKKISYFLFSALLLIFASCDGDSAPGDAAGSSGDSGIFGGGNGGNNDPSAGLITAGEWNDLENWNFWINLGQNEDFQGLTDQWEIYNSNRFDVEVTATQGSPVNNVLIELLDQGVVKWTSRTDNFGKAVVWFDPYSSTTLTDFSNLELRVNNNIQTTPVIPYNSGVNNVSISTSTPVDDRIELSFIVDATGSMSDELEFLKTDLIDIMSQIEQSRPNSEIRLSTVFYRDQGDDYVTRELSFTQDVNAVNTFINQQFAGGGGDYPEAVHSGMDVAINNFQWSSNASTRIVFILLDAPPHEDPQVIDEIHSLTATAALKGIKIIPVTASGIDKSTEFLTRSLAQLTNGTYTFITNDSGIGNDHIEPTVGDYEVEFLNDLIVRLIEKYSM